MFLTEPVFTGEDAPLASGAPAFLVYATAVPSTEISKSLTEPEFP